MRRGLLLAGLLLSIMAYPAGKLFGQAVYGSIIGTVTDEQGAAVPNARVTITNVAQGVNFETTTNEVGNYGKQHLIVGVYRVRIEAQGFQAYVQQDVQVNVDAANQVNVSLKVGAVTQTVEVTAAVPLLKTEKTDVSVSFSGKQVEELPIFNRNFIALQLLTPGSQ